MTKTRDVLLGFEVGSGREIRIPIRHLAITGQTQEAGKTTALEGLITRSGLRAVTFVTKRGEGSFTGARRIEPYFREQADWQFVASLLEASRGERMKIERAFIIRASTGALTLADVHRNVKRQVADPKVRGLAADIYLCLDAYLDVVVPEISRVRWATGLDLAAGVNAVDLTHVPVEMQHLVIKSSIDWVLAKEQNTVVVIPEAWKFLPQGRRTPVKEAADALIRQGAGLRNYVWLDSQDIGGIEKGILRHVPVWILGVQREANEIKRTLDNIPDGIAKPKKAQVATLSLGEFFACWGTHAVKTYAQPAWMTERDAQGVALGELNARDLAFLQSQIDRTGQGLTSPHEYRHRSAYEVDEATGRVRRHSFNDEPVEIAVTEAEANDLRTENATLKSQNAELLRRIEALEGSQRHDERPDMDQGRQAAARESRDDGATHQRSAGRGDRATAGVSGAVPTVSTPARSLDWPADDEARYQVIRARLFDEAATDPAILKLLTSQPAIEVKVQRPIVQTSTEDLQGRCVLLLSEGWFNEPIKATTTTTEMGKRGWSHDYRHVGRALDRLTELGFLRKESEGYKAVPAMKIKIVEG